MKKWTIVISVMLCLVLTVCLVACGNQPEKDQNTQEETPYTITVMVPSGAPALALGHMAGAETKLGAGTIDFSVSAGDAVQAAMTSGNVDFAIMPTFAGMQLAVKQGKYQLLATTSWGNLYIVTTDDDIKTLAECADAAEFLAQFAGKHIDTIGGGKVDVALNYLFTQSHVEVETQAYADAETIIPMLKKGDSRYAMIGEPAATVAGKNVSGLRSVAAVADIWRAITGADFPQASLFVRKEFAEAHPAAVTAFVEAAKQSVAYFNESAANAAEVAQAIGLAQGVVANIGECYPRTAQRYVEAQTAKAGVLTFMQILGITIEDVNVDALFAE